MNISLTPVLEQFVNDKVATGLYNSVSSFTNQIKKNEDDLL